MANDSWLYARIAWCMTPKASENKDMFSWRQYASSAALVPLSNVMLLV
jgi:hypothetical protein